MNEHEVNAEEAGVLLADIVTFVRRFVVLTNEQAVAIALWVLHTHAIDAAEVTPYLAITSPEKQSGKTRLGIEVLGGLVADPLPTLNTSVSALFRSIGDGRCTLLFDEMDAIWKGNAEDKQDLRGALNGGHKRGATVRRALVQGADVRVVAFNVFCPKALIGIGSLPDTIQDRSICIRLKRRARNEPLERGRPSVIEKEAAPLRDRAAAWAVAAVDELAEAEPDLPDELSDRAQDGAEPLLAIADLADGPWAKAARDALVALHRDEDEDDSTAVRLLADVRTVFDAKAADHLYTRQLIAALAADEEAPWATYHAPDKRITPRALSNLLRPFGVKPQTVRTGPGPKDTGKGYERRDFEDAWRRYLPPPFRQIGGAADTADTTRTDTGLWGPPATDTTDARVGTVTDTAADVSASAGTASPRDNGVVPDVSDNPPFSKEGEAEAELNRLREKWGDV